MNQSALESLKNYACALRNEIPVLIRYTDLMPQPDHLAGYAARERYNALRTRLRQYPTESTERRLAAQYLDQFAQYNEAAFENLRGELRTAGHTGLAEELNERRERRRKDLARLIEIAEDLNGKPLAWEEAAKEIDRTIANDIVFIEDNMVDSLVEQYTAFAKEHNADILRKVEELEKQTGKRQILAASRFEETLPPEVSVRGAEAVLDWLNERIGIVPQAEFVSLAFEAKFEAIKNRFDAIKAMQSILDARLRPIEEDAHGARVAAEKAAQGVEDIAEDLATWFKWVQDLARNNNAKAPPLALPIRNELYARWKQFRFGIADCELPNGKYRTTQRSGNEFLELYGNDILWKGKTISYYAPTAQDLKRILHAAEVAENRAEEKNSQKKN